MVRLAAHAPQRGPSQAQTIHRFQASVPPASECLQAGLLRPTALSVSSTRKCSLSSQLEVNSQFLNMSLLLTQDQLPQNFPGHRLRHGKARPRFINLGVSGRTLTCAWCAVGAPDIPGLGEWVTR